MSEMLEVRNIVQSTPKLLPINLLWIDEALLNPNNRTDSNTGNFYEALNMESLLV